MATKSAKSYPKDTGMKPVAREKELTGGLCAHLDIDRLPDSGARTVLPRP